MSLVRLPNITENIELEEIKIEKNNNIFVRKKSTVIDMRNTSIYNTSCIYLKHSFYIYIFAFFITIFYTILSRSLLDSKGKANWQESISEVIFMLQARFVGISQFIFGWTLFNKNIENKLINFIIIFLFSIEIIPFFVWGEDYRSHSVIRYGPNVTNFDKIFARIQYNSEAIVLIGYYVYHYINRQKKYDLKFYDYITLFLTFFNSFHKNFTMAEGIITFYYYISSIVVCFIISTYIILKKYTFVKNISTMLILQIILFLFLRTISKSLLIIFTNIENPNFEYIVLIIYQIFTTFIIFIIDKLVSLSLDTHQKTLYMFPFIFSIEFFYDLVFIDVNTFDIKFFIIIFLGFFYFIIEDSGIFNLLLNKILHKNLTTEQNIKIIYDYSYNCELSFFSEKLSLFIIILLLVLEIIFDSLGFLTENLIVNKDEKLNILIGYLFILFLNIISNFITKIIRKKLYDYYHNILEVQINTQLTLTKWNVSYVFCIVSLISILSRGIRGSPLFTHPLEIPTEVIFLP